MRPLVPPVHQPSLKLERRSIHPTIGLPSRHFILAVIPAQLLSVLLQVVA